MDKPHVTALARTMVDAVRAFVVRAAADLTTRIDDVERLVLAIPTGPKGKDGVDGKDADPEFIRAEVAKTVTANMETVKVLMGGLVSEAVAAIPKPADGKDGASVEPEAVAVMISEHVAKAVAALPPATNGRDGEDGEPGKDADMETVKGLIADGVGKAVAALPKPRDGADGKDGDSVHPDTVAMMLRDAVEKAVAALPRPKDGERGRDAAELVPLPYIDEARSYSMGTWAQHNGGEIRAARATDPVKDGRILDAGWVVMREGVSALVVTQGDDPRELTVAAMLTGGAKTVTSVRVPLMIYREVWREGEYAEGDVVTYSGSAWHCQQATSDKPGTSSAWKLMVKHGAAGKDASAAASATSVREPVRLK